MKLGEDEQKLGEFYFTGAGDASNMSVLTNRRLVVVYRNAEESYPLSKITAVRIVFSRSIWAIVFGVILALIGLAVLSSSTSAALVTLLIGAGLLYLGVRGKTSLLINQMGGEKLYAVRGKSPELTQFMEVVNSKLS